MPNAQPIKHDNIPAILDTAARCTMSAMIWGPPAIGKSESIYQWASANDYKVVEVRLSEIDVLDVRGLPYRDENNVTRYAVPQWWPQKGCGKVVLYLDEYAQQPAQAQPITGRIIHERKIGDDNRLPDGDGDHVVIFVSSNGHTDRAGAYRMPTHTASRFALHYELEPDLDLWIEWANKSGVDQRLISFLRFRSDLFYQFDPKANEYAWANPRTIVKLSEMISDIPNSDLDLLLLLAQGACGQAFGIEFRAFVKALGQLPDLEAIKRGDDVDAPDDPGLTYAVISALARVVDDANVENVWRYIQKIAGEYRVYWAEDVKSLRDKIGFDLKQSPVYPEILSLHSELLEV